MSLADTVFFTSKLELLSGDRLAASGVFRVGAGYQGGVRVIDISNPSNPVLMGDVMSPYNTGYYGMTAYGNGYLLVAGGGQTFGGKQPNVYVIDISGTTPKDAGQFDIPGSDWCWDVDTDDEYIFAAQNKSISIIKDAPLTGIQSIGAFPSQSGRARELAYDNPRKLGYVSESASGVDIIDLSNQTTPVHLATWRDNTVPNFAAMGSTPYPVGSVLFVAASPQGMYILETTDPALPVKRSQMKVTLLDGTPIGTNPATQRIAVSGARAVMANASGGYMIVDIANIDAPTLVKHTQTGGQCFDVVIHNGYVIAGETGPTIRTEPLV